MTAGRASRGRRPAVPLTLGVGCALGVSAPAALTSDVLVTMAVGLGIASRSLRGVRPVASTTVAAVAAVAAAVVVERIVGAVTWGPLAAPWWVAAAALVVATVSVAVDPRAQRSAAMPRQRPVTPAASRRRARLDRRSSADQRSLPGAATTDRRPGVVG